MMPWEHVVVGYIGYSLFVHAVYRASPTTKETLIVVAASLFPDLVDKPLAWQFGVFDSGYALAHSVFFAVPVSVLFLVLARSHGRPRSGIAFTIAYFVHLPADILPQYVRTGELPVGRVLWPIQRSDTEYDSGFGGELIDNLTGYGLWMREQILSGNPDPYFGVLAAIGVFGILLWVYDGMPIGREIYGHCRQTATGVGRFVRGMS